MTNTNKADLSITNTQCRTKQVRSESKQTRINTNLDTWAKAQAKRQAKKVKTVTKKASAKKQEWKAPMASKTR